MDLYAKIASLINDVHTYRWDTEWVCKNGFKEVELFNQTKCVTKKVRLLMEFFFFFSGLSVCLTYQHYATEQFTTSV